MTRINTTIRENLVLITDRYSDRFTWVGVYFEDELIASMQCDTEKDYVARVELEHPSVETTLKVADLLKNVDEIFNWLNS